MRHLREKLFREQFDEVLNNWSGGEAPALLDVDDTHVHNAAVAVNVDILLTNNVDDFGDPDQLPYDLYTPDQFFMLIAANSPRAVRTVTRLQALYWHKRHKTSPEGAHPSLFEALKKAGCPNFAEIVATHLQVLAGPAPTSNSDLSDRSHAHEAPALN